MLTDYLVTAIVALYNATNYPSDDDVRYEFFNLMAGIARDAVVVMLLAALAAGISTLWREEPADVGLVVAHKRVDDLTEYLGVLDRRSANAENVLADIAITRKTTQLALEEAQRVLTARKADVEKKHK